jgi:hypothetical protein
MLCRTEWLVSVLFCDGMQQCGVPKPLLTAIYQIHGGRGCLVLSSIEAVSNHAHDTLAPCMDLLLFSFHVLLSQVLQFYF